MFDRTGKYLIFAILLGMVLGVLFVAVFGEAGLYVKFLGDIFLKLLKMLVIPLLFCSMVVGITNLGDVRKLGRTGLKTILYFLATSTIAVIIGLLLVNIIRPGDGFPIDPNATKDLVIGTEGYSFFTWLSDQIPSNIFSAAAETQVLPIIAVALFFGAVLSTIGSKGRPVIAFFDGINHVIMKAVHIIMWFAPIGIFGLVAGQLASVGGIGEFTTILSKLGWYALVVILGLLIHGAVILPLILKFITGRSIAEYFIGMSQALVTSFATASSSATLPVTMDCVEEKNDVDKRASSFVLPLGATINMDGTALYEAVAALFIAQAYGVPMPILAQVTICATAVLASIGAAGIPQAGLVTMILVLQAVGLPLEGIGMILAIDWFLDRCRTTVNVWGDSIGAAVIGTTAEIGLVRRSRGRVKDSQQDSRNRRGSHRDNPRNKRQRQDPRSKSRDNRSFRDKRKAQAPKDNRPKEPVKKQDRNEPRRTVRKIHKVEVGSENQDREMYRPDDKKNVGSTPPVKSQTNSDKPTRKNTDESKPNNVRTADSPNKDTSSAKDSGNKNQDESKSAKTDSSYGRKRTRGGKPKKQDAPKKDSSDQVQEKEASKKTPNENTSDNAFEVPKFPKGILNDLATPVIDEESGKDRKSVEDSSPKSPSESGKKDSVEKPDGDPGRKSAGVPAGKPESKEEKSQDFSKLDKVILGDKPGDESKDRAAESVPSNDSDSKKPDGKTKVAPSSDGPTEKQDKKETATSELKDRGVSSGKTESDKEQPDTKTPEAKPDKSSSADKDNMPAKSQPARETDLEDRSAEKAVNPKHDSAEDKSHDAPAPKVEVPPVESQMESGTESTKPAADTASDSPQQNEQTEDTDDSTSEWGRTKKRRPSR